MEQSDRPTQQSVQALLDIISPDASDFTIHDLAGSYSNFTHLVKVTSAVGDEQSIVIRRYNPDNGETVEKSRREYKALELLNQHEMPVPKPLYLDDSGDVLGLPGIVTAFVEGKQIEPPTNTEKWGRQAEKVSAMLAKIHTVPFSDDIKSHLMDISIEGAWFLKYETIPDYMKHDPDGQMVWDLLNDFLPKRHKVDAVLTHTDLWSGNVLWVNDTISAVVDWEEAGYGDPAYDVAYCRMEYFLEGLGDAAETFTSAYQQQSGQPLENLPLWELAASVRPMTDPSGWFTRPFMEERFRRFIASAKQRLLL